MPKGPDKTEEKEKSLLYQNTHRQTEKNEKKTVKEEKAQESFQKREWSRIECPVS